MKKIISELQTSLLSKGDRSDSSRTHWTFSPEAGSPKAIKGYLNAALSIAAGQRSMILESRPYHTLLDAFIEMNNITAIAVPQEIRQANGSIIWSFDKNVISRRTYQHILNINVHNSGVFKNDILTSTISEPLDFDSFKSLFSNFKLGSEHYTHIEIQYAASISGGSQLTSSQTLHILRNPSDLELRVMYEFYKEVQNWPDNKILNIAEIDRISAQANFNHTKKAIMALNTLMVYSIMISLNITDPYALDVQYFTDDWHKHTLKFTSNNTIPSESDDQMMIAFSTSLKRSQSLNFESLFKLEDHFFSQNGFSIVDYFVNGDHKKTNQLMGTEGVFYIYTAYAQISPKKRNNPGVNKSQYYYDPKGFDCNVYFVTPAVPGSKIYANDNAYTTIKAAKDLGISKVSGKLFSTININGWFSPKFFSTTNVNSTPAMFPTANTLDYFSNDGEKTAYEVAMDVLTEDGVKDIDDWIKEEPRMSSILFFDISNFEERHYDLIRQSTQLPSSDTRMFIGEVAWNNAVNAVNLKIQDVQSISDNILDLSSKVESQLVNLSVQASELSDAEKANQAVNQMQDIITEFSDGLTDLSQEFGFSISKDKLSSFSDKFVQSQMKANIFKNEYSKWIYKQLEFIEKFQGDFKSRYNLKTNVTTGLDNKISGQLEEVQSSLERAVDKMDLYLPQINVSWLVDLLLSAMSKVAISVLQTLSIVDNIYSIMEKWETNYSLNSNFRPFLLEGETGRQFAVIGIPTEYTLSDSLRNSSKIIKNTLGEESFICANLVTKEDMLYYIVETTDYDHIKEVFLARMNDISKFVSIITGSDTHICSYPSDLVVDASAKAVIAQAGLSAAAAMVSASGWVGKVVAGATAFAATIAVNVVGDVLWRKKRENMTDISEYIIKDHNRSYNTPSKSDVIILNDFNNILMTRGSNAYFAASIIKDVVSIGAGIIGTTAMGYLTGAIQAAIKNMKTRRQVRKNIDKEDTILVNGVPMKVSQLDSTQKRVIAKNAIQSKNSPAAIIAGVNPGFGANESSYLTSYIQDIRDGVDDLKNIISQEKIDQILNDNQQLLELVGGISKISADVALQTLLLNRINRKLGF